MAPVCYFGIFQRIEFSKHRFKVNSLLRALNSSSHNCMRLRVEGLSGGEYPIWPYHLILIQFLSPWYHTEPAGPLPRSCDLVSWGAHGCKQGKEYDNAGSGITHTEKSTSRKEGKGVEIPKWKPKKKWQILHSIWKNPSCFTPVLAYHSYLSLIVSSIYC